jgi:hypothetical protein
VAPANGGSGMAGPLWWLHCSSVELGSPSTLVSGTHQIFILRSQNGVGSSPRSCLSSGGTETQHAMARLKLCPWAMVGGGYKDRTLSGTDQAWAVEVVNSWSGTVLIGEGLQRWDDSTTSASRF